MPISVGLNSKSTHQLTCPLTTLSQAWLQSASVAFLIGCSPQLYRLSSWSLNQRSKSWLATRKQLTAVGDGATPDASMPHMQSPAASGGQSALGHAV
eukprot:scaffold48024_cov57-Phaeocystis_antarctica.AAC.2